MKAYVLQNTGNLELTEIKKPILKANEVLVEVKAAGICGSDIPRIYKTGTYVFPLIPGHEFSGIVTAVGGEVNKSWMDKRVGVFPLIPCMSCQPCKDKSFELCRNYSYLGSRANGAFTEYVAVPEQNLIELPNNVSYEEAAMLEPMAVAVHAIRQIRPQQGDTIAVYGLGTIGLLLTMFLKEMGCSKVFVIGNKKIQDNMVQRLGIPPQRYCDSQVKDVNQWLIDQTHGEGVDVFFECVGKNETVNQAIISTKPNGKIQLIANPESDMLIDKDTYWKILRNQLTIKGSWNSSFSHDRNDDWHYVIKRMQENKINPEQFMTQKLSFESLKDGLDIMRNKTEEYIKIMMVNLE